MLRLRAALFGALCACSGPAPEPTACTDVPGAIDGGAWAGGPLDVPMTVTRTSSNGTMRFSVPIRIGDSDPFDAFLDTGSSGLRVLDGAVPASAYACATSTAVTYSYHSGLELQGVVAYASVTIGAAATPGPVPVMLVRQVGCTEAKPSCDAAGKSPANYTFFGPYKAILGVGMRNGASGVGNVIAQLAGHPAFVVKAPAYGGGSGTLRIAPSPADVAAFTTFSLPPLDGGAPLANGTPAYDDRYGLPADLVDQTTSNDFALPAELDTGNPAVYVESKAVTSDAVIAAGSQVDVTVGPASAPLGEWTFTVAAVPTPGIDLVELEPATGAGFMNLGTSVFFRYDVLFDQASGTIGLLSHQG